MFCLEEKTETIYFVNQNRDNYLYEMKDGVVQLVVALPVKEVYPFGDYVYFMISEDTEEQKAGDIYRYKKETKEIELVYALGTIQGGENHKLNVNEQGIHFNYSEVLSKEDGITRKSVSYYTLPFGESEPIKDTTNQGKLGWGDYYFSYLLVEDSTQPAKVTLVSRTKGEEDSIPISIGDFQYCVAKDKIYSMALGNSSILTFDLKQKNRGIYNFRGDIIDENNYVKEEIAQCFGEGMEEFSDFTMTENGKYLWFTDGEYLYIADTSDGYSKSEDAMITPDIHRKIEQLYTDGRRVYGLYSQDGKKPPVLVRFCVETIKEEDFFLKDEDCVQVEYLVPEEGDVVGTIPWYEACKKHSMQVQNEQHDSFTEEHLYLCGEIKKEAGSEEHIYQDCLITTVVDTYSKACENCALIVERLGCGEKKTHSLGSFSE